VPDSPKPSLLWLNKHPILEAGHSRDLEQAAALNEFHRKMPRDAAESAAHDEYRKTHHTKAAAYHFAGIRAAQGAGDLQEAKQHGDLYAQHMKALGEDPYGPVPEHIRLQASDPGHTKVYRFANHGADSLLGHALSKSEPLQKLVSGERHLVDGLWMFPAQSPSDSHCEHQQVTRLPDKSVKCNRCGTTFTNYRSQIAKSESLSKAPDRFQLLDLDDAPAPERAFQPPAAQPARVQEAAGPRRARQDAAFEREQLASRSKTVRPHMFTPGPHEFQARSTIDDCSVCGERYAAHSAPMRADRSQETPEQKQARLDAFERDGWRPVLPDPTLKNESAERLQNLLKAAKLALKLHAVNTGKTKLAKAEDNEPEAVKRLAAVDYVERPAGEWQKDGFACQTCQYFKSEQSFCAHKDIQAKVVANGCCNAWDGDTTYRPAEKV